MKKFAVLLTLCFSLVSGTTAPQITVSKTATPSSSPSGGTVTYTVRVTNESEVEPVTLTSLVDDLYGDLNGQGSCSVPRTIAAGDFYECSFDQQVIGDEGDQITDIVTATAEDNEGNIATADDSAVVICGDPFQIWIEKTADPSSVSEPGDTVTFRVRVTNDGPDPITITSLVDDVHGDLNGQGTCSMPQTIAANGGRYECSFTAEVTGDAGYGETDIVTARAEDEEGDVIQEASDSATVTITDIPSDAWVDKTAHPSSVPEPGGWVTFTVRVPNHSIETLTITSLVDDIHGDLNGRGTCSVPHTIEVSTTYECSFSAEVAGNAGDSKTDTVTARVTDNEGNIFQSSDDATVALTPAATTTAKSYLPLIRRDPLPPRAIPVGAQPAFDDGSSLPTPPPPPPEDRISSTVPDLPERGSAEDRSTPAAGPHTAGTTILLGGRDLNLPEDVFVEAFVACNLCLDAQADCDPGPSYVLRRGKSIIRVAVSGRVSSRNVVGNGRPFAFVDRHLANID